MKRKPLDYLAILYIVIWTISPPLQLDSIYRLLALGCAGILFLNNGFAMKKQHSYAAFFCVLVAASAVMRTGSFSAALAQIGIYMLFIGYVMNYWYEYSWEDFESIVPIALLLLALWNYRTVQAIATNSHVARIIVRNDEYANSYLRSGVGGYGLMYCQVIILPAIVQWILSALKYKKKYFVCGMIWAISYVLYLGEAGYSIAVVASFISVIVLFVYKKRSITPALIISGVVLVLLVYLIGFNDGFRNFLLNIFDGTKVASKIADITSTVTTDETADSISARIVAYQYSIQSILWNYPIIGGWWNGGAGGHSAMLDAFAQYGLFGGLIMFRMIYCVTSLWKRYELNSKLLSVVNATIISISFVVWLDSVPYNLTMMLLVILPIILNTVESWERNDEYFMDSESHSY